MLNVIMLNVIMLNVIMLNVIMLNVMVSFSTALCLRRRKIFVEIFFSIDVKLFVFELKSTNELDPM